MQREKRRYSAVSPSTATLCRLLSSAPLTAVTRSGDSQKGLYITHRGLCWETRKTCYVTLAFTCLLSKDIVAMVKDKGENTTLQYQQTLVSFPRSLIWCLHVCSIRWLCYMFTQGLQLLAAPQSPLERYIRCWFFCNLHLKTKSIYSSVRVVSTALHSFALIHRCCVTSVSVLIISYQMKILLQQNRWICSAQRNVCNPKAITTWIV